MSDRSDIWTKIYAGLKNVLGPKETPAREDVLENDDPSPADHSQGSGDMHDRTAPNVPSGGDHSPNSGN